MILKLSLPETIILKPCITVFGVGGAGGNAVNNMITSNLEGARFVVANTDAQALEYSLAERKIQLGENITRGLGAGAAPDVGKAAAEEAMEHIMENLHGSNMVFITAGMGGGTGTGAAPVIARAARENGILTVGVVTKPFHFEGSHRMKIAELGLQELQKYVDTLIVIPNQNLFRIATERTTFADAFKMADDVLHAGVRGITDLMIMPGLINLDFADISAVMSESGKAMMGTGEAQGERRAIAAAEAAIANPLLDNSSMKGARGLLINIIGGSDMTLFEVDEAANRIRDEVDPNANIIFGSTFNPDLEGTIRVSVVATGIDSDLDNNKNNKPQTANTANEFTKRTDPFLTPKNDDISQNQKISYSENELLLQQSVTNKHEALRPIDVNNNIFLSSESLSQLEQHEVRRFNPVPLADIQDKHKTEDKPQSIMSGLFGRMANSVGLKSSNNSEVRNQYKNDTKPQSNLPLEDLSDDELDIPAFLRRKKKVSIDD